MRSIMQVTALSPAAIGPYLFVKPGVADGQVVVAAAATDKLLGISNQVGFKAADTSDYVVLGEGELKLGGTVAYGDFLTSDASGQGVVAATAGFTVRAQAMTAGVAGDIILVQLVMFKF
jgi:hypothetical protein